MLGDNTAATSSSSSMNYNSNSIPRKESISSSVGSPTTTQPESYSVAEESDDLSMGSMSSLPLYHSALSVASGATGASTTNYRTTTGSSSSSYRTGLRPPLPSSSNNRNPSSDRSVKTLPPWFGDRPPGTSYTASGGRSRGGWSVASLESNDLDGGDNDGKTTVSPRMRDQMKKYLERHTRSST